MDSSMNFSWQLHVFSFPTYYHQEGWCTNLVNICVGKLTGCSGADCSSEVGTRNWRRSKKRVRKRLKIHNERSKKEVTVENNPEEEDVLVKPGF